MTKAALAAERLSVLVVEDNAADADLVREMLRDANLVAAGAVSPEIHHVETLRAALAAASRPFDVALLDLGLPDASGLDGLAALNAAAPALPAVVLTSARDPALAAQALVAGAQDFLVKSEVQGDLLLRSLRFAVARQRRAARQLAEAERMDGVRSRAVARAPGGPAAVRRVLLVEDNPGDAELVRHALSEASHGFAVHHVERLAAALTYLMGADVDVVLLDLALPDAAGLECVEKMRSAFPDLPIVVLTGNSRAGLEAVRAGVQDYAIKGEVAARDLERAIDYSIERNAHGQRARELAEERAAHAATQAAARTLRDANEQLAVATRRAHDALEREAAARAQAEQRQQEIEALFASMIDPVLVYGADRHIVSTNPAATRFFGRDVHGLLPAQLIEAADIHLADGRKVPVEALPGSRALDGAIVIGERLRVRTRAGERVVLVSASPVRRGDAVHGAVSVYRDVTALDHAEEALREADRNKSEFLTVLSHELRNPLAPIRSSLYVLDHAEAGSADALRARQVIERQVETLARLVDDLLDVTRIARGKIEFRRGPVDLNALVSHVEEDHRGVAQQHGFEFAVETPGRAVWVDADATRLTQMIGNLVHNAGKFTGAGGRVTLSLRSERGQAVVAVRDTGIGIEPDRLAHLFQPFYQAHGALKGGLGLGLALVKGIAELHGGSVRADSRGPGHGAEFRVTLPLQELQSGQAEPAREPQEAPALTKQRARRVLVVDDDPDNAGTLAEVVAMMGHTVEIAQDGRAALDKARARPPDVVFCDLGMPGMDGFELARAVRADDALRHVRLVALSGYSEPEDRERAARAGFDAHLAKPHRPEEIERLLS